MRKLSIIIPCYNSSAFCDQLTNCINSQSVDASNEDFEFILVDDGSSDDTLSRLYRIQSSAKCPITVLTKQNGGVASARNYAVNYASGEWIGFLDSDDILIPGGVRYLIDNWLTEDIDILNFGSEGVDSVPSVFPQLAGSVIIECTCRDFFVSTSAIGVWKYMYRRSFLDQNSIRFRELTIGEDTIFNFDALMCDGHVRSIDTAIVYHIERKGSLTTSNSASHVRKIFKSIVAISDIYDEYVNSHQLDPEIRSKINSHQRRQALFCFRKIRSAPHLPMVDIRDYCKYFQSKKILPISTTTWKERAMLYLLKHPFLLKVASVLNGLKAL